MTGDNQAFWLRRARFEALRFNLGWWLQLFLPWVFGLGILSSVGILALRTANQGTWGLAVAATLAAFAGMFFALLLARRKFLSPSEALVRLDADLRLHNRLSSAAQGIGEWPSLQSHASLALRWNWAYLLRPPLIAIALVLAAMTIPLPESRSKSVAATAHPPSWHDIQTRLDALKKVELVRPEAIESLQSSLDALRKQPSDQWYRHESLEASDQLQMQLDQSLGDLQKRLETALGAMEAARQIENRQLQAMAQPLDNALGQSLQGLELGKFPLNEQTLSRLKSLDTSKIRQLSAAEWQSLNERMKAGIAACSSGYSSGEKASEALLALNSSQGSGGISRGPGTAPLALKEDKTQLGTTNSEPLHNEDLSRAAVGDLMGLGTGEHQVDESAWTGPQVGGANLSAGSGGDAVWEQAATPAEQDALRRFFK
jgi:hypothetical protein